jgi:uncharacterized protein YutE (UPF0331/DUF86 family)
LRRFTSDLGDCAKLDPEDRRRQHRAVERLLQWLWEAAADLRLRILRAEGDALPGSHREVFTALADRHALPHDLAGRLVAACGMRNVLTHLYDTIDLERLIDAVDPAIMLYAGYADWILAGPRKSACGTGVRNWGHQELQELGSGLVFCI